MLQRGGERVAVQAAVTDRRYVDESRRAHRSARRSHRRYATLRRARELWSGFRVEQTDPDRFYGLMARDSAAQLELFVPLSGKLLLDIGGGPGYFADAFRARGARYLALDADLGELSAKGTPGPGTVLGSGLDLPFTSDAVDVCYSSNVLEHVDRPRRMAQEMLRVTRPGGTVFLSYTTWLSPWGGHETAPWHYLGGARAARRYRRRTGHAPKNEFGRTLFPTSAQTMARWACQEQTAGHADVVAMFPRYHPGWAHWIAHLPGVREVAVWNFVIVLTKR
jgi:SAM-dependent methyltransferase